QRYCDLVRCDAMDLISPVLGDHHPRHLPRYGAGAPARAIRGTVRAGADGNPPRLGSPQGERTGADPEPGWYVEGVLPGVHPHAYRDDRVLVDAGTEHAGFHALRPLAARASGGPGGRAANDDDRVR